MNFNAGRTLHVTYIMIVPIRNRICPAFLLFRWLLFIPAVNHHEALLCLHFAFVSAVFECFQGSHTEFVISLAAISHIKILISFRPQIIRTLIFILASIRVNM